MTGIPSWGNACETIPFPYCHPERKRGIFFRSRSSRRCEDSGIFVSQPSPQGEGAPKGRIGQERYERERGRASQAGDLDERGSVSSRRFTVAPYPPMARSPFPNEEGKEEAASPQKRKPTPPRCARQPLPREGARAIPRIVIPSVVEGSLWHSG